MTNIELLKMQAELANSKCSYMTPHDDNCIVCRIRRLAGQVAKNILDKLTPEHDPNDPNLIMDWATEFQRQRKLLSSNN